MAGRVVVVTGSGRGLGFELLKQLNANGYKIVGTARDEKKAAEAVKALQAEGISAEFFVLEVSDANSRREFIAKLTAKYPNIYAFVNNAAIAGATVEEDSKRRTQKFNEILQSEKDQKEWTPAVFKEVFDTNVRGTFDLVEQIIPHLQKGSVVVNVSSGLGKLENQSQGYRDIVTSSTTLEQLKNIPFIPTEQAGLFAGAYRASKAAVNRGTQILQQENPDIYVRTVCPGHCKTDMGGPEAGRTAAQGADSIFRPINDPANVPLFSIDGNLNEW